MTEPDLLDPAAIEKIRRDRHRSYPSFAKYSLAQASGTDQLLAHIQAQANLNTQLTKENDLLRRALFQDRSCSGHHSDHKAHPVVILFRDPAWGWLAFCEIHLAMSPGIIALENIRQEAI